MRLDNLPGPGNILRFRREDLVAGTDLFGVNERFTVEAEFAALPASEFKAGFIIQIKIDPVENAESCGAGG